MAIIDKYLPMTSLILNKLFRYALNLESHKDKFE